jgi:hypothetical protein
LQIAGLPQEFKGNPFFLKTEVKQKNPILARNCFPSLAGKKKEKSMKFLPGKRAVMVLLVMALWVAPALAFHVDVTDVYPLDNNTVTNVTTTGTGFAVFEDYNETFLKAYPSHDGFAVVNAQGNYFDKIVDFTDSPSVPYSTQATFHIINTGPFTWSDYHFELWNTDFTGAPTGVTIVDPFESDDFKGFTLSADGRFLNFFNDGTAGSRDVLPDGIANFKVTFLVTEGGDFSFGLRQVATTVPIPPSVLLMGSGLLGLGLVGWRRRKA